MLVLTRSHDESVVLILPTEPEKLLELAGVVMEVKVMKDKHKGSRTRLGFNCPQAITIIRTELIPEGTMPQETP